MTAEAASRGGAADGPLPDRRLATLAADLRARLAPVCYDWSDAEFAALVDRLARMKLRWAEAAGGR